MRSKIAISKMARDSKQKHGSPLVQRVKVTRDNNSEDGDAGALTRPMTIKKACQRFEIQMTLINIRARAAAFTEVVEQLIYIPVSGCSTQFRFRTAYQRAINDIRVTRLLAFGVVTVVILRLQLVDMQIMATSDNVANFDFRKPELQVCFFNDLVG